MPRLRLLAQSRPRYDTHVNDEELNGLFDGLRRHFDVTAERFDSQFAKVTEVVTAIDEKVDRRTNAIEDTVQRTAAETQALIRFSHTELERRIESLEQSRNAK